ncbi:MAG: hypothetical protein NVSMB18_23480 [Acetobacteraceae bacterium]
MTTQPIPAPANDRTNPAAVSHEYRRVLNELIEFGIELARFVHAQVTAPAAKAPNGTAQLGRNDTPVDTLIGLAATFDRVSGAIRRAIMLARRLEHPAPLPAPQLQAAARRRILRDIERAIDRRDPARADAARLQTERQSRRGDPDLEDDLGHRPRPEIIAEICRDLGAASPPGPQPWRRRIPTDIVALCARAARPRLRNLGKGADRRSRPITPPPAP